MRQSVVISLWLMVLSSVVLDTGSYAEDPSASKVSDLVFDPTLSGALQDALEEAAQEQGADSITASLYISDRCFWEGAAGTTEQDAKIAVEPEMLYGFGSVTKTLVAAIVLQLVEEQRLGLDDSLGKWLDSYANVAPRITVRQLLDHTSGLGDYLKNERFYSALATAPSRIWSPEDLMKYVPSPDDPPGEGKRYSNTNYLLLGLIIEEATGNAVDRELEDRITGPLDLTSTTLPKSDFETERWANGTVPTNALYSALWTAGALASTSRDVAKWGHRLFSRQLPESGLAGAYAGV